MMPMGLLRPSSATGMPLKPSAASVSSTSIPLPAPARYRHAPPRPESAPAMTMESTMLRVSLMPAYRAASRL